MLTEKNINCKCVLAVPREKGRGFNNNTVCSYIIFIRKISEHFLLIKEWNASEDSGEVLQKSKVTNINAHCAPSCDYLELPSCLGDTQLPAVAQDYGSACCHTASPGRGNARGFPACISSLRG